MYKKVSTDMSFVEREKEVLQFWKENQVFKRSIELRKDGPEFTFLRRPADGQRQAAYRPYPDPRHQGHHPALQDDEGLPCPAQGRLGHAWPAGRAGSRESCSASTASRRSRPTALNRLSTSARKASGNTRANGRQMSDRVGFWADMEDPYITYDNNYIESEWWALRKIWDKGLLYKGYKIVPYCPRCGTSLSSHEVAQGYQDVKETSVFVRFPVAGEPDTWFAAWTTTPWTLPSNVALCVNADEEYVLAEVPHGSGRQRKGRSATTWPACWCPQLLGEDYQDPGQDDGQRTGRQVL